MQRATGTPRHGIYELTLTAANPDAADRVCVLAVDPATGVPAGGLQHADESAVSALNATPEQHYVIVRFRT